MNLNLSLFYFFNNLACRSEVSDWIIVFLADYLQYLLVAIFILFLYFSSYSFRKKIYIFLVVGISVLFARFGITESIRFFYHHPRPFAVHSVCQLLSKSEWSFPSGHASFFFAMATAIYFYNKKWGIGFFIAALLMNISRIAAGIHYPFDILGGMIVGIGSAWIVAFFVRALFARDKK
ncbi:phosphatase PAP2 family protein [bacterium]|nr:phosphatase PAP2 family protein [bacterium]